ncbi:UNVERIFIED_CONTAM: hypothetical protein Scaly_0593400 [Sesamum calycinum]|uniref:Retrotransposon gag domain-containing protein n=1 Tax=Sesamum calycinum TaxID=2727403 RepID=A0AAW2RS83_9LAMI
MQTRPRAREVHGVGDAPEPQLNEADQVPPHECHYPVNNPPQWTNRAASYKNSIPPNCGHPRFPSHQGEWRTPIWHLPSLPHGAAPSPLQFWRKHFRRALKYPTSQNDGTGDPQEHLDKFYAKIDWYDLSDAAYCKVFRTTLSKRTLAWLNQLLTGTISSLEQLTQRFLYHFSMNKSVPKTSAFLFTLRQRENEPLRDYMQRFVKAVHEVPHVNHELLASIIQQNLLPERFKESIAGKPPSTMENPSPHAITEVHSD